MSYTRGTEIPTIDVNLITIKPKGSSNELALDTATKIAVAPDIDTVDAVKLVIKGVLKAQKKQVQTITGHTITLTDNVFTPELVVALQGGTLEYDETETTKIVSYTPPVAGSTPVQNKFELNAYSAVYNAAGDILEYEKITYPNCTGSPISFNREDGTFSVNEYTINSAPSTGEAPYVISYVASLPTVA